MPCRSRANLEAGTEDCTDEYSVESSLPVVTLALTPVDTTAKIEIVTAMIVKESHRFSMPILLTAIARESKVRSFQAVSYFEIVALLNETIHEHTRSRMDSVRAVDVTSWVVLVQAGKNEKPNQDSTAVWKV